MTDLRKAAERLLDALDDGWVQRDDWVAFALRQALAQPEPWDTSDMAHRSGGLTVEQTPDDLLRQSEREGWRWASECEAEVVRVTDLNQRLMSGAQELRDATDAAEFDEAWSKLFALFKEAI